jgi:hypothetical protein
MKASLSDHRSLVFPIQAVLLMPLCLERG